MIRVLLVSAIAFALGSGFGGTEQQVERLHGLVTENAALKAELRAERKATGKAQRRVRREYVQRMAERRAFKAAMYLHPIGADPLEVAFLCIYSHEKGAAGWKTNTGNGFYGGLQMDQSFQSTYGSDFMQMFGGGAHLWPRSVQIAVALRAYRTWGFSSWPNTSRMCGLR